MHQKNYPERNTNSLCSYRFNEEPFKVKQEQHFLQKEAEKELPQVKDISYFVMGRFSKFRFN